MRHHRLAIAAILILAACGVAQAQNGIIHQQSYNGHTYYLIEPKLWLESEAEAINMGGHLVKIEDKAENQWILNTFGDEALKYAADHNLTGPLSLWIGASDATTEGTWLWTDGEPVFPAYEDYWQEGEPMATYIDEDFAGMAVNAGSFTPGMWHDIRDKYLGSDICFGVVEIELSGPRTFLITFTGFGNGNKPPDGGCGISFPTGHVPNNCYPDGHVQDGQGMTNLLANARNIIESPQIISKSFAFYNENEFDLAWCLLFPLECAACLQYPQYCAPPNDSIDHLTAEFWLSQQQVRQMDSIIIIGHSYGAHRARLFAEQISRHAYIVDKLILVDPINWSECNLNHAEVDSGCWRLDPQPAPANVDPANIFVFRQHMDWRVRGYTIDGIPDGHTTNLRLSHSDMDDSATIQSFAINSIAPGALGAEAIRPVLTASPENAKWVQVGTSSAPRFALNIPVYVGNDGQLIMTNMHMNGSLGSGRSGEIDDILPGYILPAGEGLAKELQLRFKGTVKAGQPHELKVDFTSNGVTMQFELGAITIPPNMGASSIIIQKH